MFLYDFCEAEFRETQSKSLPKVLFNDPDYFLWAKKIRFLIILVALLCKRSAK